MTQPSMEEQKDLDLLQVRLNKLSRSAMDAMRHSAELDAEGLIHSGYRGKTNADAVFGTYKYYKQQMDAEINKHLKKYPD